MLTALDAELFPDDCEVVEIPSRNLWIYLIQKNGSSSLRDEAKRQGWQISKNQELFSLDRVDVILRDPVERYLSGANTFVQHLMRDEPTLDRLTCTYVARRFPFLNRHYLPQWHWIANLARFLNRDCKIYFHGMDQLSTITDIDSHAGVEIFDDQWAKFMQSEIDKLDLWFLLDKILLGYCGQHRTWQELLEIYRDHPTRPLDIITERTNLILDVLRPT